MLEHTWISFVISLLSHHDINESCFPEIKIHDAIRRVFCRDTDEKIREMYSWGETTVPHTRQESTPKHASRTLRKLRSKLLGTSVQILSETGSRRPRRLVPTDVALETNLRELNSYVGQMFEGSSLWEQGFFYFVTVSGNSCHVVNYWLMTKPDLISNNPHNTSDTKWHLLMYCWYIALWSRGYSW